MENQYKKKILILGGLCLLLLTLTGLMSLLPKRQVVQQRAAGSGVVKLLLNPSRKEVAIGESLTVRVRMKSGTAKSINAAGVDLQFDPNVFTVSADTVTCGGVLPGVAKRTVVDNKIFISCFKPEGEKVDLVAGSATLLGSFTLQVKNNAPAGVSPINFVRTYVADFNTSADLSDGGTRGVYTVVRGVVTGTPTPTVAPAGPTPTTVPANQVVVFAVPNNPTVLGRDNQAFSSKIYVNAGSAVKYVKLSMSYSPENVTVASADFASGFSGNLTKASNLFTLEATRTAARPAGYFELATLQMKVNGNKSAGGASYIKACSNAQPSQTCNINGTGDSANSYTLTVKNYFEGDNDSHAIIKVTISPYGGVTPPPGGPTATPTVTPGGPTSTPTPTVTPGGPTLTPTPTVTPPPGGWPVLNFKIKFQGVASKRADQKVRIVAKKAGLDKTFSNVNMVADDNGIYSGSVTLTDVPAGNNYRVSIKGPKHLSRKFCENNQAIRCVGTGKIALVGGANTLDFSKIVLEAGDLPNPNDGGKQDGVVNSIDYSLWKTRIGKEDNDNLAVADVNFDGIVNQIDWQLMRVTLETKYEEEE